MNGFQPLIPLAPIVLLLASCSSAPAGQHDSTGQAATLASVCSGCHAGGTTGTAIVSLDKYSAEQIASRFRTYRDDPTGPTAMHRMARGYSDEQIQLIADYLGQP